MNRPSEELLHKTLENRATAAEAASVAEWLATDSGQAWASRYIGRDFDRQESCGDYEREEVASERIFARIKTALTRGRRRRILFRVAAVVIPVALVLGVALRLDRQVGGIFSDAEYGEFVVDRGRRTQCLFQDGTVAHLNSESKIHYPVKFGLFERRIRLEGEAYFEVARNEQASFSVYTRDMNLQVLGTSFNIKAYPDETETVTTLLSGSIEQHYPSSRQTLKLLPSQQSHFDCHTGNLQILEADPEEVLAWKNGKFIARDKTLEEIFRELTRWYDFEVVFTRPALRQLRFHLHTNRYASIREILDNLQSTNGIHFSYIGNKIYISQ